METSDQAIELAEIGADAVAAIAGLHAACFDTPWPADDLHALFKANPLWALGAADCAWRTGRELQGAVIVRHVLDEAEILTLGVRPRCRRRGIARALIRAMQERLRGQGGGRLFLDVAADNSPARALYDDLGFRLLDVRKGYYGRPGGRSADAHVLSWEAADII